MADGDAHIGVSAKSRESLLASSDSDAAAASHLAERLARYDFRSWTLGSLERAGEEGIACRRQNRIGPGMVFDSTALASHYLGKQGACGKLDGVEASVACRLEPDEQVLLRVGAKRLPHDTPLPRRLGPLGVTQRLARRYRSRREPGQICGIAPATGAADLRRPRHA